jgi:hypothetical protein
VIDLEACRGVAQQAEQRSPKPQVAGSNPVSPVVGAVAKPGKAAVRKAAIGGSNPSGALTAGHLPNCGRGSVVERLLAKEKVVGSNPIARSVSPP